MELCHPDLKRLLAKLNHTCDLGWLIIVRSSVTSHQSFKLRIPQASEMPAVESRSSHLLLGFIESSRPHQSLPPLSSLPQSPT